MRHSIPGSRDHDLSLSWRQTLHRQPPRRPHIYWLAGRSQAARKQPQQMHFITRRQHEPRVCVRSTCPQASGGWCGARWGEYCPCRGPSRSWETPNHIKELLAKLPPPQPHDPEEDGIFIISVRKQNCLLSQREALSLASKDVCYASNRQKLS